MVELAALNLFLASSLLVAKYLMNLKTGTTPQATIADAAKIGTSINNSSGSLLFRKSRILMQIKTR